MEENENTEKSVDLTDNLDTTIEESDSDVDTDLDSTLVPNRSSSPIPADKQNESIFNSIEAELDKQLNEKARRSNLTVFNVKTIIKQVLTNEYVRAFLDRSTVERESEGVQNVPFEPKLTRSKAKELLSANVIPLTPVNIPWASPAPLPETQVLIGEDLKEDDSGDEYVPGEEESDDDKDDHSAASESDIGSLPPPTPPAPVSTEDHATQTQTTNYTDDGVFKIPPPKTSQEEEEEAANVALRTRSKINLSSTPLEELEKSFIPPDITTDMYDMDCDDDDWKQFLQEFTEPLEEVIKPTEDEEQDPEYNIMADDEINHIDNEDFRIDKAVKITKKEVKQLWEELFEYLNDNLEQSVYSNPTDSSLLENQSMCNETNDLQQSEEYGNTTQHEMNALSKEKNGKTAPNSMFDVNFSHDQLCILEQQMRQHIQMLTQNFILTYEHPEFHEYSGKIKEYLLNLKFLSEGKCFSAFRPVNLIPALHLVDYWTTLTASNSNEVKKTKEHVQTELFKSIQYKMAGNWEYLVTFPKLVLETISNSEVFLYPSLLPKIPFKSEQFSGNICRFTDAEDYLLVFAIDMYKEFLSHEQKHVLCLKQIVSHIKDNLMPHRSVQNILKHIYQCKHPRVATNPIQQYMLYGKLKPMVHYVYPLNQLVPPCKRLPEELPTQWKDYIYPYATRTQMVTNQQIILLTGPVPTGNTTGNLIFPSPPLKPKPKKARKTKQKASLLIEIKNGTASTDSSDYIAIKGRDIIFHESGTTKRKALTTCAHKTHQTKLGSKSSTSLEQFVSIFLRSIPCEKLVRFFLQVEGQVSTKASNTKTNHPKDLLDMPNLITPVKTVDHETSEVIDPDTTKVVDAVGGNDIVDSPKKSENKTSDEKKSKVSRNLEFSTITSSFQKENASTEVEFCRNSSNIQICQMSQCDEQDVKNSSAHSSTCGKDNLDDRNVLTSSTIINSEVKPNAKKKVSTSERKKNKLRKDFLTNLSVATPDSIDSEKYKNEMFAIAYYDKLRESLDLEDYNKIMQVLNDFESGDAVDLYRDVQAILRPKYYELAEDFLFFLKEKEASAVGQLMPWLELQARVKFLRKLEIYLKDQPSQLKKIYNTMQDLAKAQDVNTEKIKSTIVPMLKGNAILMDLFLQNFPDERPPPSLLEGPYKTLDLNKELARGENEELYETFVVPNTEDKYGGPNCICHCHRIEDNEYKSRLKHCNSCGLKFANGKLYLAAGRSIQPATVTFKTSPHVSHNLRLMGKSATSSLTSIRRKRSEISPNKLISGTSKETLEEDTEDEEFGKRKKSVVSQRTPRKRKKVTNPKYQQELKPSSPKKSPARSGSDVPEMKDPIKSRRRTYSGKRLRKEEIKTIEIEKVTPKVEDVVTSVVEKVEPTDMEFSSIKDGDGPEKNDDFRVVADIEESEHETSEENRGKSTDECMDSSGESLEKPSTPGHQTTESEPEIYLEESSQDNFESDDSSSSAESESKGSQSDSNTNDEPPWRREEDTIILETLQKEDDKEYALQIISDKLPNRTIGQIRSRLSRLMDLLIETLKNT